MKHRKLTAALLALLLAAGGAAGAEVVEVTGTGEDSESALRDAKRNAVETVLGTYIDSKTIVDKAVVIEDEIYAKSAGFAAVQKILSEGEEGGVYTVRARIDVDTNPNSALLGKIEMLRALEDPRIAVIVFRASSSDYDTSVKYDDITEEAINSKLLDMGFSYVMDTNVTAKLRNSGLLSSIYNGNSGAASELGSAGLDILVLAKCNTIASPIKLMQDSSYGTKTETDTLLIRGTANITGKIIAVDTGIIKGTFSASGQGVDISNASAERKASIEASGAAAAEVEKALRKKAVQITEGMQITVSTEDESKVQQLIQDLKRLKGVEDVHLRDRSGGKYYLDVNTSEKPHTILRMLKEKSSLGIFNEGISGNSLQLIVS